MANCMALATRCIFAWSQQHTEQQNKISETLLWFHFIDVHWVSRGLRCKKVWSQWLGERLVLKYWDFWNKAYLLSKKAILFCRPKHMLSYHSNQYY